MKIDDLSDRDRRLVREQLLDAQSRWLEESEAEGATPTLRTLALVMADAFRQEAELYKSRGSMMGEASSFFETRDHSEHITDGGGATAVLPA